MALAALAPLAIEGAKMAYDAYQQHKQNEYNSPKSQMKRYMQAGINPSWAMANPSIDSGNQTSHVSAESVDADKLSSYYRNPPGLQKTLVSEQVKGVHLDNEVKVQDVKAKAIQNQMMTDEAKHKDDYWSETIKQIEQLIRNGKASQALTVAQKGLVNAQTGTEFERQNFVKQQALRETYRAQLEGMLARDPYMYTGEFTISAELAGTINSAMDAGIIKAGYGLTGRVRAGMKMTPSQFAHVCGQLGTKVRNAYHKVNKPATQQHWWNFLHRNFK